MVRFTPGELEVMQVLWKESPLKPADVEARLERPIGNAALRSVLRVLLEKGHVKRSKQGKAYYYRPTRSVQTSFRQMTRKMAELFCGGSSFDLIAQLVKSEKLTEDDLRQLQKIALSQANTPVDPTHGAQP